MQTLFPGFSKINIKVCNENMDQHFIYTKKDLPRLVDDIHL